MEKFLTNADIIRFNVGGELMLTSRASLLHIAESKLARQILTKSGDDLSLDSAGHVFLDVNPDLFRHLLEQLRLFEPEETPVFSPPSTAALIAPFNNLLHQFGLAAAPESDDDVFTFNVGDRTIATKRATLKRVPSLLSIHRRTDMDASGQPFLDYDPTLFRHLLSQLHGGQATDFEAPSNATRVEYDAMLVNLGLTPKAA